MSKLRRVSQRVLSEGNSGGQKVWSEIIKLAQGPNIVCDLGQGFPDFEGTKIARDEACRVVQENPRLNQYSPVPGTRNLREALADHWNKDAGIPAEAKVDVDLNVVVVTSATEAIYAAMQAIVDPGDEVIIFEPYFPWYLPAVKMAGGKPITLTLRPPGFGIDFEELENAITDKTKLIMFNSPHNPTGHVATAEEISKLAELVVRKDLLCISDEVYEAFVFNPMKHIRLAHEKGMANRTLTLGSSSKLFSLTGWRVGWVFGPPDIVSAVSSLHAYNSYCAPTPFQEGSAVAIRDLDKGPDSIVSKEVAQLGSQFQENARRLGAALEAAGAEVIYPDGGYFLVCDTRKTGKNDVEFARWMATAKGVVCVPMSVFHNNVDAPDYLVRFAICKKPETIDAAVKAITGPDITA
eukprot:CAMPEP_0171535620 /NCGR_PEP_ID=MMETSP0959-20130129/17231_1 /TAXON_ID=87120 /ORGANISM="Aurantiochytrium limacinum, Strain ATCCMYA-1381" /LENGTH=408 /DNA_ID=CAMNT_0012081537 /DNA_START=54 /DNA_END=1280 /DNA_ORIENTATION=+